ncbi:MAG: toll/interleukin-1 receptor domain-containing protein [Beijerinckiaceae bacterium]
MTKSVFLSYSRDDREFAQELAIAFGKLGVTIYDPSSDVAPGSAWAKMVTDAISGTDATVAILPISGVRGANGVFFEIGAARTLGKPVLAVSPDRSTASLREVPSEALDMLVLDARNKSAGVVVETLLHALEAA